MIALQRVLRGIIKTNKHMLESLTLFEFVIIVYFMINELSWQLGLLNGWYEKFN